MTRRILEWSYSSTSSQIPWAKFWPRPRHYPFSSKESFSTRSFPLHLTKYNPSNWEILCDWTGKQRWSDVLTKRALEVSVCTVRGPRYDVTDIEHTHTLTPTLLCDRPDSLPDNCTNIISGLITLQSCTVRNSKPFCTPRTNVMLSRCVFGCLFICASRHLKLNVRILPSLYR